MIPPALVHLPDASEAAPLAGRCPRMSWPGTSLPFLAGLRDILGDEYLPGPDAPEGASEPVLMTLSLDPARPGLPDDLAQVLSGVWATQGLTLADGAAGAELPSATDATQVAVSVAPETALPEAPRPEPEARAIAMAPEPVALPGPEVAVSVQAEPEAPVEAALPGRADTAPESKSRPGDGAGPDDLSVPPADPAGDARASAAGPETGVPETGGTVARPVAQAGEGRPDRGAPAAGPASARVPDATAVQAPGPAGSGVSSVVPAQVAPSAQVTTPAQVSGDSAGAGAQAVSLPAAGAIAAPVSGASPAPAGTLSMVRPDWPATAVAATVAALTSQGGTLVLDLAPEDLGRMLITVTVEGDRASVRFQTETPEAARLLADAERQLSAEFARNGLTLTGHEASADRRGAPTQAPGRTGSGQGSDAPDATDHPALPVPGLVNLIA